MNRGTLFDRRVNWRSTLWLRLGVVPVSYRAAVAVRAALCLAQAAKPSRLELTCSAAGAGGGGEC